jgi:hypothetical protein
MSNIVLAKLIVYCTLGQVTVRTVRTRAIICNHCMFHCRGWTTMQRIIYIATRRKSARLQELFASMRDDMAMSSVELILDRRYRERRTRADDVATDRRKDDRRSSRETDELTRKGWVRIVVESP